MSREDSGIKTGNNTGGKGGDFWGTAVFLA